MFVDSLLQSKHLSTTGQIKDVAEQTFSPNEAHRWFAVEMNNQAWDLLESDSRTDQDNEVLRNTAHAAWRHWGEGGTPVN